MSDLFEKVQILWRFREAGYRFGSVGYETLWKTFGFTTEPKFFDDTDELRLRFGNAVNDIRFPKGFKGLSRATNERGASYIPFVRFKVLRGIDMHRGTAICVLGEDWADAVRELSCRDDVELAYKLGADRPDAL